MMDIEVYPVVGLGVSGFHLNGKTPYTIVEVVSRKELRIQEDSAHRINGTAETQEYRYEPNPKGIIKTIVMVEKGLWYEKGQSTKTSYPFVVGERRKFHDFSTPLANLWVRRVP